MKRLITIIAALFALNASASDADATMGLHLGTYHSPNIYCDNGHNPGVYFSNSSGLTVGTYYNSCKRQSHYFGWKTPDWHGLSIMTMVVTNYNTSLPGGLAAAAFPSYRIDFGKENSIRLSGASAFGHDVYHLSYERRF